LIFLSVTRDRLGEGEGNTSSGVKRARESARDFTLEGRRARVRIVHRRDGQGGTRSHTGEAHGDCVSMCNHPIGNVVDSLIHSSVALTLTEVLPALALALALALARALAPMATRESACRRSLPYIDTYACARVREYAYICSRR